MAEPQPFLFVVPNPIFVSHCPILCVIAEKEQTSKCLHLCSWPLVGHGFGYKRHWIRSSQWIGAKYRVGMGEGWGRGVAGAGTGVAWGGSRAGAALPWQGAGQEGSGLPGLPTPRDAHRRVPGRSSAWTPASPHPPPGDKRVASTTPAWLAHRTSNWASMCLLDWGMKAFCFPTPFPPRHKTMQPQPRALGSPS